MGKIRRALTFLFVLMLFLPLPVRAAQFSGEYLLYVCGSDKNGAELVNGGHAACQAYIAGIIDYHNLLRSLGTAPSVDFCIPEDVELYELQHKVVSYVFKNRSAHSKFIASPGVALALFSAYPCKK